jgi:hypothetical protein
MKFLAKFLATNKGQDLKRTNPKARAMLVKWKKYQLGFKNRIKHSLPHNGDHPAENLQVIFEWDAGAGRCGNSGRFPSGSCGPFYAINWFFRQKNSPTTERCSHPFLSSSGATSQMHATQGCTALVGVPPSGIP